MAIIIEAPDLDEFINNIKEAYENGGSEAIKELCRNTHGPGAVILYTDLLKK